MQSLRDRTVVITGASSGIGLATFVGNSLGGLVALRLALSTASSRPCGWSSSARSCPSASPR